MLPAWSHKGSAPLRLSPLGPSHSRSSPPPQLSIRCGNRRFKVFANGQPLFNYNHRFHNFQQIDTLEINGDVVLSYVQF